MTERRDDRADRIRRWRELHEQGRAAEAADVVRELEGDEIPAALLSDIADAPVLDERAIRSGARTWKPHSWRAHRPS